MRLLLGEDDPNMADVLRRGLEEEGYSILVASDGRQGLDMAESCELDAIILEVMLPKLDGFEVVRRLRRNQNPTPILMLTARDTVSDVVTGPDQTLPVRSAAREAAGHHAPRRAPSSGARAPVRPGA